MESKNTYAYIAIVAIVAIVAMVVLMSGTKTKTIGSNDLAGNGYTYCLPYNLDRHRCCRPIFLE